MTRAIKTTIVAVYLFLVSIWVVTTAGLASAVGDEVRVPGLMTRPTAIAVALVGVAFGQRAKLLEQFGDDGNEQRKAA